MPTIDLNNEQEWLIRAAHGDELAFAQLFYAYHNELGAYILRLTKSPEIMEEIVQDIFVKIWTRRETLSTIEHFGPYLYVLSRNHTLNCLRQLAKEQSRKQQVIENLQASHVIEASAENLPDYYMLIDQAVEKLPSQQRKVYLFSQERLKYKEIAQRMNISRETVKKYLKLATRFVSNYVRANGDILVIMILATLRNK